MYNRQLDAFIAAAEEGSFSKAAARLYVTPSAVLQQVAALESDLGARLFDRTNRGVAPTAAGTYLLGEARRIVAISDEARRELDRLSSGGGRVLRVGINYFHALKGFYRTWFEFQQSHADCTVETVPYGDRSPDSLDGIDLVEGVLFDEAWQRDFDFIPMGSARLGIALPEAHPMAGARTLALADLAETPVIVLRPGTSEDNDRAARSLEKDGVQTLAVESYGPDAFILASTRCCGILLSDYWGAISSSVVYSDVDWSEETSWGFFVRKRATGVAAEFRDFASEKSACE